VNKDEIHVTIDRNRILICAEVRQEKETKEGGSVTGGKRSRVPCFQFDPGPDE
jgi:HSP20 family molecular chaperone IbpA